MPELPETEFARGPNGYIAYQVFGEGPPDLLVIESWGNSIDLQWDSPLMERWLRRLGSWGRVIRFDKRSEGASDTLAGGYLPAGVGAHWIEEVADDIGTVADEVESDRFIVLGLSAGSGPAMVYAATRPDRVAGLVVADPIVRMPVPDGEPGVDAQMQQEIADTVHRYWGKGTSLAFTAPSLLGDRELRQWFGRYERLSMPRGVMARYFEVMNVDLTSVLPHVQAPTEVLIHEGALGTSLAVAEAICAAVPNSSLRQIASTDAALWAPHPESVYQDLRNFIREVAGIAPPPRAERVFAVCLYTDVVGSTRHLVEVGDQRWQELLDVHD